MYKLSRLAALLVAGAINGGLWEGWNMLTRTGWIYTVPWLDWFHVFEMPLAGYLGFPLLAIECAVLWSVLDRMPDFFRHGWLYPV